MTLLLLLAGRVLYLLALVLPHLYPFAVRRAYQTLTLECKEKGVARSSCTPSTVFFTPYDMLSFKLLGLAVALCSLTPIVPAQPNNTTIQIEAIQAHFNQSGLVPVVLPKFTPTALLAVSFKGLGKITIGQAISKERE